MRFLVALLFAIGLWSVVRQYTPITDEGKLETEILRHLNVSTEVLATCRYFKQVFPAQAANFNRVVSDTNIYISRFDLPGICGLGVFGKVILFPEFWSRKNQGCWDRDPSETVAHELLHVVGLPRHAYSFFDSEHERLIKVAQDPIELTITACYEEAYAKANS